MCINDVDFTRHDEQHARVQDIEFLQVIQRDTRVTRLLALFDVLKRHFRHLGQKDVDIWVPSIFLILVRIDNMFFWSHKVLLKQVFPKHMARAEETPFVNDDVPRFHGLKRLKNFQLK